MRKWEYYTVHHKIIHHREDADKSTTVPLRNCYNPVLFPNTI
jgi:hypothetical protein